MKKVWGKRKTEPIQGDDDDDIAAANGGDDTPEEKLKYARL